MGWVGEATVAKIILGTGLLPVEYSAIVSSVSAMIIFTIVHAVFTDLVPKNIAIESPVKVLLFIVRSIQYGLLLYYLLSGLTPHRLPALEHIG